MRNIDKIMGRLAPHLPVVDTSNDIATFGKWAENALSKAYDGWSGEAAWQIDYVITDWIKENEGDDSKGDDDLAKFIAEEVVQIVKDNFTDDEGLIHMICKDIAEVYVMDWYVPSNSRFGEKYDILAKVMANLH